MRGGQRAAERQEAHLHRGLHSPPSPACSKPAHYDVTMSISSVTTLTRDPRQLTIPTKFESAKTDPVWFKWSFGEGRLKKKFAFFEAPKNPIPKRRKLLANAHFYKQKGPCLKRPLNCTGSVFPLLKNILPLFPDDPYLGPATTQNLVVKFDGEICGAVLVEYASDDFPSKRSSKISFQTLPEVRHKFCRRLRQLHSGNRWCLHIPYFKVLVDAHPLNEGGEMPPP